MEGPNRLGTLIVLSLALACGLSCQPDRARIEEPTTPAVGACCNLDTGACAVLTAEQCAAQTYAHSYQGDNTSCSPNPCPSPAGQTGACCNLDTGGCSILTESECAAQGYASFYQGDGTLCVPNPCPAPHPEADYQASQQISSSESAKVETATGAAVLVPKYAVPLAPGGAEGKMVFSIEREHSLTPILPAGVSKVSEIYRFGPEEFTFAKPVRLTLPLWGAPAPDKQLLLYRINQSTGKPDALGGLVDSVNHTVSIDTYKLSPWFVGSAEWRDTAWGALHVTNLSSTHWLNLCVVEVQLKYPLSDADFVPEQASSAWAPVGEIGWNNAGDWFLPQGTYRLCAQMSEAGTATSPPGEPSHTYIEEVVIDEPWSSASPSVVPLPSFTGPQPDWTAGACDCTPEATPPVGTGQIQVTLTWHSASPIDLDLFVTDPAGDRCYYGRTHIPSGGELDIDNKCGNYVDGRPENIFWDADAPTGEYKVEVDWYSDCGSGLTSMPFQVRVVNGPSARTYTMTSVPDSTLLVTRFSVTGAVRRGAEVLFGEPLGIARAREAAARKD